MVMNTSSNFKTIVKIEIRNCCRVKIRERGEEGKIKWQWSWYGFLHSSSLLGSIGKNDSNHEMKPLVKFT